MSEDTLNDRFIFEPIIQSGKSDKNAMKKKINLYYNVEVEQDLEIKSKE